MSVNQVRREENRIDFVNKAGWGDAEISALPVDASARCYFRLSKGNQTRILMDAPPGIAEPVEVFAKVARHLLGCGISVPEILVEDIERGFLLLEDFGEKTYAKLLQAGADEEKLYGLAVDVLVAMHSSEKLSNIDMPPYDLAFLVREALIMADWFYPSLKGEALTGDARQQYVGAWCEVFEKLSPLPITLTLRDFHIDNLMILDNREGGSSCGLLDFQTAVLGVAPYDLMSLVEDARRDIEPEFRARMLARYFSKMGEEFAAEQGRKPFMDWYYVLSVQRHAKVLGLFSRLHSRDGKDTYLKHIPRVSGLMAASMEQDILKPVRVWFDKYFPDFRVELRAIDKDRVTMLATKSEALPVELS